MLNGKECFTKDNILSGVDYVFHTAAPFMSNPSLRENDDNIRKYIEATQTLVEASVTNRVKKIVFTGSASSVVGQFPVDEPNFVY